MRLRSLACFALVLVISVPGVASTFTAGVGCNGPFQESVGAGFVSQSCINPTTPLGGIGPAGSAQQLGNAGASVSPFAMRLGTTAILDVTGGTSGNASIGNQAWGIWEFDDFLVTGTGSQSISVLAAMHLAVSGALLGSGLGDSQGPLTAFANGVGQIYFEIEINGTAAGYGQASYAFNNGSPIESVEGLLIGHYGSGGQISDSITSSQLVIPVGQTFQVRVYVNASARGVVSISGTPADQFDTVSALGGGVSDFSTTVTFPTAGPVFDLPAGYTLSSPSAGIVDNRFVVPEPGVAALLAAFVVILGRVRRFASREAAAREDQL
jgi:hypothetical protein